MGKVATALIQVTVEYEVDQTFEDDMALDDMYDNWDTFVELEEGCMPDDWEYVEVEISRITCEGEDWERWQK